MKKIRVILILIGINCFFITPALYPQFIIENINRPLNSTYFSNNRNGFIFDGNIMYKTKNEGLNWGFPKICSTILSNYTSGKFFFTDSLYGWSSNGTTKIIKTVDGGVNWYEYLVFYVYITDLFFVNRNTGWAIANENQSPYVTVYKTVNSGLNWTGQSITGYEKKPMLSIHMRNENTGWIGLDTGKAAKTTDGGNTWIVTNFNSIKKVSLINFKSDNCGWIWLNPGQILRTTNAGANWNAYNMLYINENTKSSYFMDSLNGWVTTDGNHLLKTTNGGQNWLAVNAGITGNINNICFNNSLTGWVVTSTNQIIMSTNAGLNWATINNTSNDNYNSVYFNNFSTGWIVTGNGAIYKTTNAGINWNVNFDFGASSMSRIYFHDLSTGWISGSGGYFFKTTNSGVNWKITNTPNLPSNSMDFVDQNTGWLAGNHGSVAKTINGGNNWTILTPVTSKSIKDIDFYNNNNGILCGDTGTVYITSNSGNSWNQIHVADSFSFSSVKYYSQNEIFIAGYYNYRVYSPPGYYVTYTNKKLFKSSNNGTSWITIVNESVSGYYPTTTISIAPGSGGICIVAKDPYIKVTFDGGNSWSSNASPNLSVLSYNGVFMLDNQHIWAVGDNSAVISSFTPIIGINQISEGIPQKYSLYQNIPNPFNPITKIKFDISSIKKNSPVKISIYDILGRLVSQVLNKTLSPGVYEVNWDASSFASGIYFYTLEAQEENGNKYIESKKMVLLK